MTVAALPGNIRFRAFQLGAETAFATPVPATRRMPWRFTPTVDPHWTTPDVDTGTLDPALPPYRTAIDVTGQTSGPLAFDDIPDLMTGLLLPVTPAGGGTAKTWTALPASLTPDNFQLHSAEHGDETTDQFRYESGVIEKVQLTFPEDQGPVQHQADWRFASATYPHVLTPALSVDSSPHWLYAADTSLYIDDAAGGIGGTQLVNTMHGAQVTISQAIDVKRFSNGSNTRFQAAGYGRGARTTEVSFTFAKSVAGIAEAVKWLNANATERFVSLKTVSPDIITGVTPFSNEIRFAGYWFTRSEATAGQSNSALTLVCRSRYNATLTYAQWWETVCARATL